VITYRSSQSRQLLARLHQSQAGELLALDSFRQKISEDPLVFVLPVDPDDHISVRNASEIGQELSIAFGHCKQVEVPICELDFCGFGTSTVYVVAFVVSSKSRGKFLDTIKKVIYQPDSRGLLATERFKLANYGLLVEEKTASKKEIITQSFVHGAFYRLRYRPKRLNEEPELRQFLDSIAQDIPNDEFQTPPRCSDMCRDFDLNGRLSKCRRGEMAQTIVDCPLDREFKSEHEHVQVYFLNADPKTVACEIPVWVGKGEDLILDELLESNLGVLTGHIDLIRISDGLIWIWDYKPAALYQQLGITCLRSHIGCGVGAAAKTDACLVLVYAR
jgi:hypothetical protein